MSGDDAVQCPWTRKWVPGVYPFLEQRVLETYVGGELHLHVSSMNYNYKDVIARNGRTADREDLSIRSVMV